jgi:hypothetical protein
MYAILSCFIAAGCYHTALTAATHNKRLPFQCGIVDAFNRNKKSVKVKMSYDTLLRGHGCLLISYEEYAANY